MSDPRKLSILTDLRRAAKVTLVEMARACGLAGTKSRESVAAWERGESRPRGRVRSRFIEYLGHTLGLRSDPSRFHEVWAVLVEAWDWEPLSEAEWHQHFGEVPEEQRPSQDGRRTGYGAGPASAPALFTALAAIGGTLPQLASLPPGSRMPLSRNPLFVGRADDLRFLAQALVGNGGGEHVKTAAITGIAGIGKTQLAVEFVHRYGQYFAGGVFWLSFADPEGVPGEIAACGGLGYMELRPDFENLPLDARVRLVQAAWEQPVPRLLIFDNCEDEALLARWRPVSGGSTILLTSRRAHWDATLGVQILALGVLRRDESITVIRAYRPGGFGDTDSLDAIAEELGDLPLALHLAGNYLARHYLTVTPAGYLEQLRDAALTPSKAILDHPSLQDTIISPTGHIQHVARTFALSYARLSGTDPVESVALALLERAAYFAPGEPVPRELLISTWLRSGACVHDMALPTCALSRLTDLGLIEAMADGSPRLHRLVAAFVQARATDTAAQAAVEQTLVEVAETDADDIASMHQLERHLRFVTDTALGRSDGRAARLCRAFGYYLWRANELTQARRYIERAVAIWEQEHTHDPLELAETLQLLALVLQVQSRFAQAHPLFVRSLGIFQEALGPDHLTTSNGYTNLGFLLILQGEYAQAAEFLRRALRIRRRASGLRHPETAHILHSLGFIYLRRGAYRPAIRFLTLALAIRREVLPAGHFAIAQTMNFLGEALCGAGERDLAWQYLEHALTIRRRLFGEGNAAIGESMYYLGRVLHARGDLQEAREYLERAVENLSLRIGADNILTAQALGSLGALLYDLGQYADACSYLERAIAIWEQAGGAKHPELVPLLGKLALTRLALDSRTEARALLARALRICRAKLGRRHPDTIRSRAIVRGVFQRQ